METMISGGVFDLLSPPCGSHNKRERIEEGVGGDLRTVSSSVESG